eukprot:Hpha_TRINITY_DN22163_c0_g1::TRINITY_DN22163_c0_g1_i1::g.103564::m.103564
MAGENWEIRELMWFSEPEIALSPDDLDRDIFPQELTAFESFESAALVLGKFVVVSCVFSFGSDACAQYLQGRRWCVAKPEPPPLPAASLRSTPGDKLVTRPVPYDWSRTIRYMGTGTVFVGASQFLRLGLIAHIFDPKDTSIRTVIHKTAVNQFLLSPVVNAGAMFMVVYSRDRDCEYAWEKLKDDFCEAQMASYCVKPLGNLLAFLLFPSSMTGQLLITRSVAFFYNIYFSILTHRDIHGEHVHEWVEETGWEKDGRSGDEKWYWHTETHATQWWDPREEAPETDDEAIPTPRKTPAAPSGRRPSSAWSGQPGSPRPHELRVRDRSCASYCAVM